MTKKILIPVMLFLVLVASAQRNNDNFKLDFSLKLYGFYPIQFGDHALAKAHDAGAGFGTSVGVLSYKNFSLQGGFEYVKYNVTDQSLIGNISSTNYSTFYVSVAYEMELAKKFKLFPDIGYGKATAALRSNSKSFGHQSGNELRLGVTGNYYISENISLFVGLHFIHTALDTHTNAGYEKFFGQADQLQLSAGIKVD